MEIAFACKNARSKIKANFQEYITNIPADTLKRSAGVIGLLVQELLSNEAPQRTLLTLSEDNDSLGVRKRPYEHIGLPPTSYSIVPPTSTYDSWPFLSPAGGEPRTHGFAMGPLQPRHLPTRNGAGTGQALGWGPNINSTPQ